MENHDPGFDPEPIPRLKPRRKNAGQKLAELIMEKPRLFREPTAAAQDHVQQRFNFSDDGLFNPDNNAT